MAHSLTVYVPVCARLQQCTSVSHLFPDSSSPLVIKRPPSSQLSQSEDSPWSGKRSAEDTVSIVSSLHSSPTISPQGSPRKGIHPGYCILHYLPLKTLTILATKVGVNSISILVHPGSTLIPILFNALNEDNVYLEFGLLAELTTI